MKTTDNKNQTLNKKYWEDNIEKFAGFYDRKSEENINAPLFLKVVYKKVLFPIEKFFMKKRYNHVKKYLLENIKKGNVLADIGCGSGVFTKIALDLGAKVLAIDYVDSALILAKNAIKDSANNNVELINLDITKSAIPKVDVAISIGVLTYIDDLENYFNNVLPNTNKILFNFMDIKHPLNRLRILFKFLDVRKLSYHSMEDVILELEKRNFKVIYVSKLATGYIISSNKFGD